MAIIPKWLQFNKKEDKAAAVNMNPDKQLTQLLYRFLANNQILYNPESDESFIQYGYKYNSTL